jgi:hypothetical protein
MKTELILLIGLVVLIIIYLAYRYLIVRGKKEKLEDKPIKNTFSNNKVLSYFGAEYCPFSNTDSNAYKIIKDFENEYGDRVTIKYYWSETDADLMKELNIVYVPTILNSNNNKIELAIDKDVDTKNLSNEELKSLLLENIYNNC